MMTQITQRIEVCRYSDGGIGIARRPKKQLGERVGAGPVRDPQIPAAGEVDTRPVTDDDLGLDVDVPTAYDDVSGVSDAEDRVVT